MVAAIVVASRHRIRGRSEIESQRVSACNRAGQADELSERCRALAHVASEIGQSRASLPRGRVQSSQEHDDAAAELEAAIDAVTLPYVRMG
jgi:hypothetical protein